MLRLARIIASLFYLGYLPGMPGTYASVVTALVFYAACSTAGTLEPGYHLCLVFVITLAGVASSAKISRSTGVEDPSYIVVDEVAGQLITFLFVPVAGWNIAAGILAFRVFDIWKPWPIRKLERLGKGAGVMADDLLAGIYANIVLQIINVLV